MASSGFVSECCKARVGGSLADGVLVGTCGACGEVVTRMNPVTGVSEWLDGESPWTKRQDLRPVAAALLPVAAPPEIVAISDVIPAVLTAVKVLAALPLAQLHEQVALAQAHGADVDADLHRRTATRLRVIQRIIRAAEACTLEVEAAVRELSAS